VSDGLKVDSVTLQERPKEQLTDELIGRGARAYILSIAVSNVRGQAPSYVAARISNRRYDAASRTLYVGLGTSDSGDRPFSCPPRPLPHVEVAPGARIVIEDQLVSPFEYVEDTKDQTVSIRMAAIDADVQRIECDVAYSDVAPPTVIDLTAAPPVREGARELAQGHWQRSG
jgi:hypothetical protein